MEGSPTTLYATAKNNNKYLLFLLFNESIPPQVSPVTSESPVFCLRATGSEPEAEQVDPDKPLSIDVQGTRRDYRTAQWS